jgi:hypothetical protein
MKNFISLDVEATSLNGNTGYPYAIAAVVYRNGIPTESINVSCPLQGEMSWWVENHPELHSIKNSQLTTYEDMMVQFANFYKYHACRNENGEVEMTSWGAINYNATPVLFHCGMVVEGNMFRQLVNLGLIDEDEAPMSPIDVCDYLRMAGENPASVDSYVEKHSLQKAEGQAHDPMFDAQQAATTYLHLIGRLQVS